MIPLLSLSILALLLALLVTPIVCCIARRVGCMDQPDGVRRRHTGAVPRVGGVAVAISIAGSAVLTVLFPWDSADITANFRVLMGQIGTGVGLVFLVGLADDLHELKPRTKLAGQGVAAFLAFGAGIRIETLGPFVLEEWQGFALTMVWLVGCSNALNLIDGVDGLAAGTGLIAATAVAAAALLRGDTALAMLACLPAAALLGFLRYNRSPASIFLGDSGSLTIGFLLGCFAVMWSQRVDDALGLAAPLITLTLPLADTGLSIFRRLANRQSIFSADRNHIHHRLLGRGFGVRKTILVLYGVGGTAGALAVLQSVVHGWGQSFLLLLYLVGGSMGVRYLGYVEFRVIGRFLAASPAFLLFLRDCLLLPLRSAAAVTSPRRVHSLVPVTALARSATNQGRGLEQVARLSKTPLAFEADR